MGIRGELFSTRFSCEGRTYFFNVKENRNGDIFLSIVESKPTETETFDRRSIVIFRENMEGFMRAMRTAAGYMEKAQARPNPEATSSSPVRGHRFASAHYEPSAHHEPQGDMPRKQHRIVVKKRTYPSGSSNSPSTSKIERELRKILVTIEISFCGIAMLHSVQCFVDAPLSDTPCGA